MDTWELNEEESADNKTTDIKTTNEGVRYVDITVNDLLRSRRARNEIRRQANIGERAAPSRRERDYAPPRLPE